MRCYICILDAIIIVVVILDVIFIGSVCHLEVRAGGVSNVQRWRDCNYPPDPISTTHHDDYYDDDDMMMMITMMMMMTMVVVVVIIYC